MTERERGAATLQREAARPERRPPDDAAAAATPGGTWPHPVPPVEPARAMPAPAELGAQGIPWPDIRPSPPATSPGDPVREACGVAAGDILRRCGIAHAAPGGAAHGIAGVASPPVGAGAAPGQRWRLLDLAEGPPEAFVRAAYAAILDRPAAEPEVARRVGELRLGRSRIELVARLALCPEGRRVAAPPVAGLGLPALVAAGRTWERALAHPRIGGVLGRSTRPARQVAGRTLRGARLGWRLICAVPVLGGLLESLAALPRLGRLQREVTALRAELDALRREQRP
jgi:hypothetical protein